VERHAGLEVGDDRGVGDRRELRDLRDGATTDYTELIHKLVDAYTATDPPISINGRR